jgi:stage II sporulation protein R
MIVGGCPLNRKLTMGLSLLLAGLTLISTGWVFAGRSGAAGSAPGPAATDWSQQVIRLHVVANSDSEADQDLKRAVRDAVLNEVTPLFTGVASQAEALTAIDQATPQIQQAAAAVVAGRGQHYPVRVELGRFTFPGKAYGALFLPAGEYMAVKVLIGESAGANWWCVLFPPLCFTDWTTGLVLEPKPGTGGRETVTVHRAPAPSPVLVDEEQARPVEVRGRSLLLEKFRRYRMPNAK